MKPIGWKSRICARSSLCSAASRRASRISPSSMLARWTAFTFSSKALAIASSTRLSRRPMRKSPLIILITYLASIAVAPRNRRGSSHLIEGRSQVADRQRTPSGCCMFQHVLSRGSQIAIPAVGSSKRNFSFARYLADSAPQQSSAHLQGSFLPGRKGAAREEHSSLCSFIHWSRAEVHRYQPHLFKLLRGGCHSVGGLGKSLHYYEDSNCRFSCPFLLYSLKILF